MKSIQITGTHNRYQMKKVTRENEMYKYRSRVATSMWDSSLYEIDTQMRLLLEIQQHLIGSNDDTLRNKDHLLMKKELDTKLNGYRFQDQNKKREGKNISFVETIDKLINTRLMCYYCNTQCNVFYERVREMSQWSFDRIDNSLCHSVDNVVVACLKCNLHRKNINSKKFKDTKEMKSIVLVPSQKDEDLLEYSHDGETIEETAAATEASAAKKNTEKLEPFTAATTELPEKKGTIYRPKAVRSSVQELTDDVVVDDGVVVPVQK